MERSDVFASLILLAVIAFQVWVTLKVRRSTEYDPSQKSAQTKLIWLLPLIGAAIAFSVLETEDKKEPPDRNHQS